MLSLRVLKSKNHTGHCVPISSGRKWCGGRWNNDRTPVADGTTVGDDQDGGTNFLNVFVSTVLYLGGRKKVQVTNSKNFPHTIKWIDFKAVGNEWPSSCLLYNAQWRILNLGVIYLMHTIKKTLHVSMPQKFRMPQLLSKLADFSVLRCFTMIKSWFWGHNQWNITRYLGC